MRGEPAGAGFEKSAWRGPRETGAQRLKHALDRGRTEREEQRYSGTKRLCDAGKKISSIKHHIAVDSQGLPHAIAVTTADVTDRKGALAALGAANPA